MHANFQTQRHLVEAVRWDPANPVQMQGLEAVGGGQAVALTPKGAVGVSPGDWIVTYEDGRRHVYKPDEFSFLFEAIG